MATQEKQMEIEMKLKVKVGKVTNEFLVGSPEHAAKLSRALQDSFELLGGHATTKFYMNGIEIPVWEVGYNICDGEYEYAESFYIAEFSVDEAVTLAKNHIQSIWQDEDFGEDSGDDPFVWNDNRAEGGTLNGRMIDGLYMYQCIGRNE